MSDAPQFDALRRGHTVLASDPFNNGDDRTRPWVVVNNERHPFDGEQYVVMALTTRTWYDERIPVGPDDFTHRQAPEDCSIVPPAVASLAPDLVTDYICRIRDDPLDRAVEMLERYL